MARFDIRLSEEIAEQIHRAVSEQGFESVTAFIRQAILNELRHCRTGTNESEARTASYDRLTKDVRRLQTAQQTEYALIDSFVKLFLICVPEPSGNQIQPAKARAAARYHNFLQNVAHKMTGDAQADLELLLGHVTAR
jgi:Arc/MetJ-type ribon-helix-helix transcriptional regulator